jgi:hypothetical protein
MGSGKTFSEDLELITGIGPDAREWLAENFDVRTFAALADLSVEELVDRIRADNKPWLRWAKDWPADAAKRVAEMEAEAVAQQPERASGWQNNSALSLTAPSAEVSSPKPTNSVAEIDGWDTLALYFIEFQSRQVPGEPFELQTKVVFEGPGDQAQKTLSGLDQDRACEWISEHMSVIAKASATGGILLNTKPKSQKAGPQTISVSQLRFFQPAGATGPLFSFSRERPNISMVRSDQPFDLEVILEGSSAQVSENGRAPFSVRFLVKDWDSGSITTLGDVRPQAIEGQPAYSALLSAISLPRGKYQVKVLAFAHPEPALLGSVDIRMLSVW